MSANCQHLGEDGICNGTYKGFGCIGERCVLVREAQSPKPKAQCGHLHESTYCSKHHKFFCPGMDACETQANAGQPAQGKA
ncbi:MAG: hypothetical protein V1934_03550 [Methanobacteriota archaeon]